MWRDVLPFTEILQSIDDPKYELNFNLALGWYDYSLSRSAWRLTPSKAKSDVKLCDNQRFMDSDCENKPGKFGYCFIIKLMLSSLQFRCISLIKP